MSHCRIAFAAVALSIVSPAVFAQATAAATPAPADCADASIPDQKKDEDTIRRIEQGWLTAEMRGNPQFLACLLDPDYRTAGRNGQIRTRQDVIDHVQKTTDLSRPVPQLDVIVFVHGDAASAHSILRTTDKDGKPKEVHFVDSYTFHDGRWHAFGGADL